MAKRKGDYVAGPGRTPLKEKYGEELIRTTVRLPKSYIEHIRQLGDGEFSVGLRKLIEDNIKQSEKAENEDK